MADPVGRLFERHNINFKEILYITRNSQRTYIQMLSGACYETSAPVKTVAEKLPENDFWNIQKGVLVAKRHIVNIDKKHNYTMVDGRVFEGRHRTPGEHNLHRQELFSDLSLSPKTSSKPQAKRNANVESGAPAVNFDERCSIMEDAPIAFCVIELVFHEDGRGIDFVFRYCNKEMAVLEGVPVEDMLGRSFYEVFPNGDKKWIVPYADVALNGNKHILHDFSPEINKNLTIRCFQPARGYCACILTEDDSPSFTSSMP